MCGAADLAFAKIDKFASCTAHHPVHPFTPRYSTRPSSCNMLHSDSTGSPVPPVGDTGNTSTVYSEDDLPEFSPMPW